MSKFLLALAAFSTVVCAQNVVLSFATPENGITGLAVNPSATVKNELWALSSAKKVYCLDATTGTVKSSFSCDMDSMKVPTGLAIVGNQVFAQNIDGWVLLFSPSGEFLGRSSFNC